MKMYPIGTFSKITQITVKALRHYQDKGILEPSHIDENTGYRYYNEKQLERAYTIQSLKELDFSLKEIADIMNHFSEDSEMVSFLKSKSDVLIAKIERYSQIKSQLDWLIKQQEKESMKTYNDKIEIRQIPDIRIASIRYKGRYDEIGEYFKKIFKIVGFNTNGKPGALYYDMEYKEKADIEAFIPVKVGYNKPEIAGKPLSGGKAHCLIHKGPYQTLNRSYKKLMDYLEENKIEIELPIREVYLKGPGMIFSGNPDKYLTELMFIEKE